MTKRKLKLPPDIDGMNGDRAQWAEAALRFFETATGSDRESSLSDLLGDLLHWCDRNGQSFTNELERAQSHYQAETGQIPY